MNEKKSNWKHIIEKLFCLHQYQTVEKVEIQNRLGHTVELNLLRTCTVCGKHKVLKIS